MSHYDHDIHGPVVVIGADRSTSLDEDCDCPPDCQECEVEGIAR